jgi:predicted DNA-binding transcriptional regulator AlpA
MFKKYLTMEKFADATGYSRQSIYNMIYKKMLILDVHYRKPSSRKILIVEETVELLVSGAIHRAYEALPKSGSGAHAQHKDPAGSSQNKPPGRKTRLARVNIGGLRDRLARAEETP